MNLTNLYNFIFAHTILYIGSYPKYLLHNDEIFDFIEHRDDKYWYKGRKVKDKFFIKFSKTMYGRLINIRNKLMKG